MTLNEGNMTPAALFVLKQLKLRGLIKRFVTNAIAYSGREGLRDKMCSLNHPCRIMDTCFLWAASPEGHIFWAVFVRDIGHAWDNHDMAELF